MRSPSASRAVPPPPLPTTLPPRVVPAMPRTPPPPNSPHWHATIQSPTSATTARSRLLPLQQETTAAASPTPPPHRASSSRVIRATNPALAAFRRSPERMHRTTASALRKATMSSAQAAVFVARQQRRTERKEARLASLRDARDAKIKARAMPQFVARTRRVNKMTPAAARARSSQIKTPPSSRRSAATSSTGTAMSASRTPRSSAVHRTRLAGARSRRSTESTPPLSRNYSPKTSPTSPSDSLLLQAFALGCNPTRLTPPEWRPVGSASSHAESSGACPRLDRLDAELLVLSMRLGINGPDPLEFVDSEEEEGPFGLVAPHSTSSFLPRDSSAGRNIAEYPASVPLEGNGTTTTSARHYFDDGSLVDSSVSNVAWTGSLRNPAHDAGKDASTPHIHFTRNGSVQSGSVSSAKWEDSQSDSTSDDDNVDELFATPSAASRTATPHDISVSPVITPSPYSCAAGRVALLVVDMQRAFITNASHWGPNDGERNNPRCEMRVRELLAAFRQRGLGVLHARHDSTEGGSPLAPGLASHGYIDGCAPLPSERVFAKNVNSAFVGTGLEAHLRDSQITDLVICGITSTHCVNTTTRMAGNLGFAVRLCEDACATFARRNVLRPEEVICAQLVHECALSVLHGEFCDVTTVEAVVASLT